MALYVKQNDTRSELQKRLASELQDKARAKAEEAELPDGVTDSQFIKGTKGTSGLAWVWITLFLLIIAGLVWLVVATA